MIDQSDLQGGCVVPLLQSIASGGLGALAAFSLALLTDQAPERAAMLAMAGGALAALACWLWRLGYWHRALELDQAYQYDLWTETTDPAGPETVRVELAETDGANRRQSLIDLPGSPGALQALARGLLEGAAFSQAAWTGAGSEFTRSEFAALQAAMIRRGLARWNTPGTPARGMALTAPGRAVMRRLAGVE